MGTLVDRGSVVQAYLAELRRYGLPKVVEPTDREVLFLLDGVGGFQAAVLMVRRVLRQLHEPIGTVLFRWQCRPPGRVLSDLIWHRRNRRKAAELAEEIVRFRDEHPNTVVHLMAYSGGCGVAVFACESLRGRRLLDTLILACPAISPEYDLGPALAAVKRCYALVSRRDSWILGLGTRIFGTTDRRHTASAGMVGFQRPTSLPPSQPGSESDVAIRRLDASHLPPSQGGTQGGPLVRESILAPGYDHSGYENFFQIQWSPELIALGHHGGHTGWASTAFLREHLLPLLRGEPKLPVDRYGSEVGAPA